MKTLKEIQEAANAAQQAAIAVNMKKAGKKPKNMEEEKDYEYEMARNQLVVCQKAIERLMPHLKGEGDLPAWVQSKITLGVDYIDTVADYMDGLVKEEFEMNEVAAWQRSAGKNKNGGLNEKGRKSYEREHPGSDLKAPSKKKGNKRRKSFCARMKGMKAKLTSKKTARDPDSRINKSLRAWNC
jgi:hypothetical protein